jgi:eukaryotic-like serine/threonine-protein kinase
MGFQVDVPAGWQRRYSGSSYVDYVSPDNSAQYLRIDQVPKAGPSALQAWVDYEPTLKARLPGYQRIRLASVPFRQWEAADLEWTYEGSNGTLHVLDRGFITHPRGFALLMQGPDATWSTDSLPVFNMAAQTFRPTS